MICQHENFQGKELTSSRPQSLRKGEMARKGSLSPLKTRKALEIKDFNILVKLWLRQSDVMLGIVMLLTSFAVM